MKACSACGKTKMLVEYRKRYDGKDGLRGKCKDCMKLADAENRRRNKSTIRWNAKRHLYGMEREDYERLLLMQDSKCAICGADAPNNVDHDHDTGAVRGMLCRNCNLGLANFSDSKDSLIAAIRYLHDTRRLDVA